MAEKIDHGKFINYSELEGLSNNNVSSVVEDKLGFVWIGTANGLNRFDGHGFKKYYALDDKMSIPNNYINCLFVDSKGRLWGGTRGGGIFLYIYEEDKFLSWSNNPNVQNCLINNNVLCFGENEKHEILIGTGQGLSILDDAGNFRNHVHDPENALSIGNSTVNDIFLDENGDLWLVTWGGGLSVIESQTTGKEKFINYDLTESRKYKGANEALSLDADKDGLLWISTYGGGIVQFNRYSRQITNRVLDFKGYSLQTTKRTLIDKNNNWWVLTDGRHIFYLDISNQYIEDIYTNLNYSNGFRGYSGTAAMQSSDGTLWIGTRKGINKYFNFYFDSRIIKKTEKEEVALTGDVVLSIYEKEKDVFIVGLDNEFLNILDLKKKSSGILTKIKDIIYTLNYNNEIWYVKRDKIVRHKNLSNEDYDRYVYEIDKNLNKYKHALHYQDFLYLVVEKNILSFNLKTKDFSVLVSKNQLKKDCSHSNLLPIENTLFFFDSANLYQYNISTEELDIVNLRKLTADLELIITTTNHYKNGSLLIGTNKGIGFFSMEKKSLDFIPFNDVSRFNEPLAVIADTAGNVWITSMKYLIKLDPIARKYYFLDSKKYFSNTTFTPHVIGMDYYKNIYMGGQLGLNIFNPYQIKFDTSTYRVAFTEFRIFQKEVPIDKNSALTVNISLADKIELSYADKVFSLSFTMQNYSQTETNKYAYMLEGLDEKWNEINTNSITFSQLPPGKFILRVKALNSDGIYGISKPLMIIVRKPFYMRYSVWGASAFLLFLVVWLYTRRKIKLDEKRRALLEQKVKTAVEEVEQQKQEILNKNEELIKIREAEKKQHWANEGMNKFTDILHRDKDNMEKLLNNVIKNLVEYMSANQGCICLLYDDKSMQEEPYIERVAGFALSREQINKKRYLIGEGEIGGVIKTHETKYIKDLPEGYTTVSSGLGEENPGYLLIVPLKYDKLVLGALELASFKPFEDYEIDFVKKLSENITSTIYVLQTTSKIQRLYQEVKMNEQELRSRESNLMKELERLKEDNERLREELKP